MSAAARAEARRKAILSRGSDRLSKLTTSARGEDAPAYMHDDPPLPTIGTRRRDFGDESVSQPLPYPAAQSPTTATTSGNTGSDPSVWSDEQQRQFMQAIMGVGSGGPPLPPSTASDSSQGPLDDPMAALMSAFPQFNSANSSAAIPGMGPMPGVNVAPPKPKTTLQKLLPLIHLVATWCLLAYFVLWREPEAFDSATRGALLESGRWRRWAELGWRNVRDGGWTVQAVPFFWTFMALQIILHSLRIFSRSDIVQPPTLLALALPHLPPPFPSLLVNGLKYMQMGGMLLDDLAGLIVGLGVVIWVAGWVAG